MIEASDRPPSSRSATRRRAITLTRLVSAALGACTFLAFNAIAATEGNEPTGEEATIRAELIVRTAHTMFNRIQMRRDSIRILGSRYKGKTARLGQPVEFDNRNYFHPAEPSRLVLDCTKLKGIGVWYFLDGPAVRGHAYYVYPSFRWTITNRSGASRSREHTRKLRFRKNTSYTGSAEIIEFDRKNRDKDFYRRENAIYTLEASLNGKPLFDTSFELENCEVNER